MKEQEIIEDWFQKYQGNITNFLVYFTGTRDVEDLVQEVFIRAFKSLNHFQHNADPKTWLISIARNLVIDQSRRGRLLKRVSLNNVNDLATNKEYVEKQVILRDEYRQVMKNITNLKRNYREVIVLRGIMHLSVRECCEILNWSESKVNVSFHRALKKLREMFDREEELINESK